MLRRLVVLLSATLVVSGEPNISKAVLAEAQFEVGRRLGYTYEVDVLSQEPYRVSVREYDGKGGTWKVHSLLHTAGKDPADAFSPSGATFAFLSQPPVGRSDDYQGGLEGGVVMFRDSGGREAWLPLSSISRFSDRGGHTVLGF